MAAFNDRHLPTKRRAAEALMLGSDLTMEAVAAEIGVPYTTVVRWNRHHGWRPWVQRGRGELRPERWSPGRLAALARLYREPAVDPADLAEALGIVREKAGVFFRARGFADRPPPVPPGAVSGQDLRKTLRGHVARQIGALDAQLLTPQPAADSAKILRDLAGLKRLVDELDQDRAGPADPAPDAARDAAEGAPEGQAEALRAAIAGRFASVSEG